MVGSEYLHWPVARMLPGAPFWFDLLAKSTNLRGTGAKPPPDAQGVLIRHC
jgi:hypothetical protein